eukprot:CAMPEP_0183345818 /NCGR_PEP_ID=MMETSP0164_2-20130417/11135_1 /TAXON_ID=221442 /ORGANISM="Coccolithus pelagicus ssp braarudi, Strain PLY182g" /LENGTH=124 /DNA_ID=CAMNT_0025517009 /DNA_START=20 /DNA_END=390 /DNA_ORIENTATION=-
MPLHLVATWASAQLFAPPSGGMGGICATQQGATTPRGGKSIEEWWLLSAAECETRCGLTLDCTAYEFAEFTGGKRGYRRCNLYKTPVTHSIPTPGFKCLIKIAGGRSTPMGGAAPTPVTHSIPT